MRKKPLFILAILFLSSIIRLFMLGKIPAGLSLTEVKFGLTVSALGSWVLNPMVIRLPFALLGILSIYIFYLLVKKLFENEAVALVSSFLLAVVPWHVQESRIFSWGLILFTVLIFLAYLTIDRIV
jgi:predicted membrane-bound mannosyltransferase